MGIATVILLFFCNHSATKRVHSFQPCGWRPASWRRQQPEPDYTTNTIDNTNRRKRKRTSWLLAAEIDTITTEEIVDTQPLSLKFKQRDDSNGEASTSEDITSSSPSSPIPIGDRALANKYYQKKLKLAAEDTNIMTADSPGMNVENRVQSTDAPLPPANVVVPRRRRYADFGIASERAEPIDDEFSTHTSESNDDSPNAMSLRGFSELGRPPNQFYSDNESPLSAVAARTKEKEQMPTTSSTMAVPQQTSKRINTQTSLPTSTPPTPISGLDIDTSGEPMIIFGITISLLLGIYLKQISDSTPGTARWSIQRIVKVDNKQSGFFENITIESKNLLQKIKDAGTAGAISYALWEAAFWGVSIPVCLVSYRQVTGRWPDLTSGEDLKKLGLEAFAFVNVARLAVPIRIGLALSTVPWVTEKILPLFSRINEDEKDDDLVPASDSSMFAQVLSDDTKGNLLQIPNEVADDTKLSPAFHDSDNVEVHESVGISKVESRLRRIETETMRISSMAAESMTSTAELTPPQEMNEVDTGSFINIYDYCEPGQINNECSESIRGYLDSLARTGAIASDGEVKAIVGYLDSLSSNVLPMNSDRGAAFTTYLDALSMGTIPAPTSAETVANYLDVLSNDTPISITSSQEDGEQIGSRINDVEERLSRLESSIVSLPDEIASRLVNWQVNQDKKMNDDMEKIMKLLVDGKSTDN